MGGIFKPSQTQAARTLEEHGVTLNLANIRQQVHAFLEKLDAAEKRLDAIGKRNIFQRAWGAITGQNDRDMVASMREIATAQRMTMALVLALAVACGDNVKALDSLLDELEKQKGIKSRITDHIEFLYEQVEEVKKSAQRRGARVRHGSMLAYMLVAVVVIAAVYAIIRLAGRL